MALIAWIVRTLVILFLIRIVLRFLTGLGQGAAAPGQARTPNQPSTREGGHLVRDPQCGTYVPMARAIRAGSGDGAIYFCSDTCRQAWAHRKAG